MHRSARRRYARIHHRAFNCSVDVRKRTGSIDIWPAVYNGVHKNYGLKPLHVNRDRGHGHGARRTLLENDASQGSPSAASHCKQVQSPRGTRPSQRVSNAKKMTRCPPHQLMSMQRTQQPGFHARGSCLPFVLPGLQHFQKLDVLCPKGSS